MRAATQAAVQRQSGGLAPGFARPRGLGLWLRDEPAHGRRADNGLFRTDALADTLGRGCSGEARDRHPKQQYSASRAKPCQTRTCQTPGRSQSARRTQERSVFATRHDSSPSPSRHPPPVTATHDRPTPPEPTRMRRTGLKAPQSRSTLSGKRFVSVAPGGQRADQDRIRRPPGRAGAGRIRQLPPETTPGQPVGNPLRAR